MNESVNSAFWECPPWQHSGAKHRLGLRPVDDAPVSPLQRPENAANKLNGLQNRYDRVVATTAGSELAQKTLHQVPGLAQTNSAIQVEYPDPIATYAAGVEEDLCLMDVAAENRLIAACVCAPSYWRLLDKIGLPLTQIHAPVQGMNKKIGPNIARFFEKMPLMQTFRRENWFVHGQTELYHPDPEDIFTFPTDAWVMRCEYQTLYKITPQYVLFGIRIVCEPLVHIHQFRQARNQLIAALERLDEDETQHFGGAKKRAAVLSLLS